MLNRTCVHPCCKFEIENLRHGLEFRWTFDRHEKGQGWMKTNGSHRSFFFPSLLIFPLFSFPPRHLSRQTSKKNELETWLPRFSLNWNCLQQWCNRVSNRAEIACNERKSREVGRGANEFFSLVLLASLRTTRLPVKFLAFHRPANHFHVSHSSVLGNRDKKMGCSKRKSGCTMIRQNRYCIKLTAIIWWWTNLRDFLQSFA